MLNLFELIFVMSRLYTLRDVLRYIEQGGQYVGLVDEVVMSAYLDYHIVIEHTNWGSTIVFTVFDNQKVVEYIAHKIRNEGNFVSNLERFPSDYREGWTIRIAPIMPIG